jgi:hypothetical protein
MIYKVLAADRRKITAMIKEATVSTSETSVNFYETTWCNIPEDSHLQVLYGSSLFNGIEVIKWKR